MKLLYDTITATLRPYPRSDDAQVQGLDPRYLEMVVIQKPKPQYDVATQQLKPTEVIDVSAKTVTRDWAIESLPPILPGPPDYVGFENALHSTASVMVANRNRMVPTLSLSTPATNPELRAALNSLATANELNYEWGRFQGLLDVIIARRGDGNNSALIARFQARLLDWLDAGNFGSPARAIVKGLLDQFMPTRNYVVIR
jgi:hypothetical protein